MQFQFPYCRLKHFKEDFLPKIFDKEPSYTKEVEAKILDMFQKVTVAHSSIEPRISFFSQNYVLYRIIQLLELDIYLGLIVLTKNMKVIENSDKIWKNHICSKNGWKFIDTIQENIP